MSAANQDDERAWPNALEVPLLDHVADPRSLRGDQLLQAIAIGVTAATGEAFFRLLARHLAQTLQCACAVVGVLLPENPQRVRTLAFYADHQLAPNIEYDLAGTPCQNVVARKLCVYPSGVQRLFPSDRWLQEWHIESYAGTPLYDSQGRILGLISILSRQPLADPDAVRSALTIYAVRAAAELERQQMEQALARLAQLARVATVGELVASIAHEVNQPLYAIANFSSAIAAALSQEGELPLTNLRHWNEEIAKAAARAGEIIRRVRSYVSRGPTIRRPIDLAAVIEESAALVRAEARRRHVQLRLALASGLPLVIADPVAVQQVLVNLLSNALEAMDDTPSGERTITVYASGGGREIEVAVEDAGVGLTDRDLDRIFTAFYTSRPSGMGLGLAISKTIIEAHHGRIWATRNPARGSTFHFTLPGDLSVGSGQ